MAEWLLPHVGSVTVRRAQTAPPRRARSRATSGAAGSHMALVLHSLTLALQPTPPRPHPVLRRSASTWAQADASPPHADPERIAALLNRRDLSLHVLPGASVLYVRATRTGVLRAVRTGGAGQLAPCPPHTHTHTHRHCAYGVRAPASGVLNVPRDRGIPGAARSCATSRWACRCSCSRALAPTLWLEPEPEPEP